MTDATRSKLLELIGELRSEKANLEKKYQAELEKINNNILSVQRTLELLSGEIVSKGKPAPQLRFDMVDIAKAKSQIEAVKIMARQSNGVVNITQAADTLIRAGRSTGKRRNLVSGLHNILSNSDEWEWVSPGNFKLKNIS